MQHEVDVLDEDPRGAAAFEEPENITYEGTLVAIQAHLVACHGEILAGEACCDEFGAVRQGVQGADVAMARNGREPALEYGDSMVVVLAEQDGRVARRLQTQLEPADTGEKARHAHSAVSDPDQTVSVSDAAYAGVNTNFGAENDLAAAIDALHHRCGVYTRPSVVRELLDRVGWRAAADLSAARLLEPAAGNGAFVVEAAARLVQSFRRRGLEPCAKHLRGRILAFELHAEAAAAARSRVAQQLKSINIDPRTAAACARAWIREDDYLLSPQTDEPYTHVVGNPPYLRWSRVPAPLRSMYEKQVSPQLTRGDLYLPFLDKALTELKAGGRCGFICSDRWQFASYGAGFWRAWEPRLKILRDRPVDPSEAFTRKVSAYASIFVARKLQRPKPRRSKPDVRTTRSTRTLADRGCVVRVGPALGITSAFVVDPGKVDVEPDLLLPWVDSSEIRDGTVRWGGRCVISVFNEAGGVVDLTEYPRLQRHLARHKRKLKARYIVQSAGHPWYRTIERLNPDRWRQPKLLVPDIAKNPTVALDTSGLIPSHGLYAIFPPADQVEAIHALLRDGGLANALSGIAPTLKNGYVRCYKHFLNAIYI